MLIDTITVEGIGYLNITDDQGNVTVNVEIIQVLMAAPDKAIIIQDKSGDQYVVQKDKATGKVKVTKVEGGGLPPVSNIAVTQQEIDLLKKVLKELKNDYSDGKVSTAQREYSDRKKALADYQAEAKQKFLSGKTAGTPANGDAGGPVVLRAEIIQNNNDDFSSLSAGYKRAEGTYNVSKVIQLFCRDTNTNEERTIIIQHLKIGGVAFGDYVNKRKKEGATEDQLKSEIKQEIVSTVANVLKSKY